MSANDANDEKKFFAENAKRFGNPHTEAEKHNLYCGLHRLACAIADLENKIYIVHQELLSVKSSLRK